MGLGLLVDGVWGLWCKGKVSNSLTLESWKVRTLRVELRVSNKFWVIFHFLRLESAIFTYLFPPITASKLIFEEFYMFSSKHCRNYSYFITEKYGKVGLWNLWNSVLLHCILQFLEKLESWLEWLNTPLLWCGAFWVFWGLGSLYKHRGITLRK